MSVDTTKLVNLASLLQFKTRQDAYNANTFVAKEDIEPGDELGLVLSHNGNDYTLITSDDLAYDDNSGNVEYGEIASILTTDSTISASQIDGVLDISNIPPAALERVVTVQSIAARNALTTDNIQLGDVVHVYNTTSGSEIDKMFFVVDTTNLDSDAGYKEFRAGAAASVPWSGVTDKPASAFGTTQGTFAEGNHTHGNITTDGKLGSTANLPVITGQNGAITTGTFGTGQYEFAEGNHDHASDKVTAMTGYSKGNAAAAIGTSDSLNTAIGKLEYKLDDEISNTGDMGSYAKAQSASAISTSDSIVDGLGKLEYKLDDEISNTGDMGSYAKAQSASAISTSDSIIEGLGKLEYKVDNVATDAEIDEEIFGIVAQSGD